MDQSNSSTLLGDISEVTMAIFTDSSAVGPLVAKCLVTLITVNGLAQMVAPRRILQLNGAPAGPFNSHIMTCMGTATVSYCITLLSLIWGLTNTWVEAVGYSMAPWIIGAIVNLAAGKSKRVGYEFKSDVVPLINGSVVAFACLTDCGGYGKLAAKSFAYFTLVSGATLVVGPAFYSDSWGTNSKRKEIIKKEPIFLSSLKALGLNLLMFGSLVACLDKGFNTTKAFGYSWMFAIPMTMLPLFDETMDKSLKLGQIAWFLPHALIIGTTVMG